MSPQVRMGDYLLLRREKVDLDDGMRKVLRIRIGPQILVEVGD